MPYAVTPLASKSYKFTQSRYDDVPVLPMRALCLAPSGSGKSVLLQRMITDIFDGCFAAGVHIFSHSINIDDTFTPVKQWMEKNEFSVNKYCHDKYDETTLAEIMAEQKSVVEYQKKKGHKSLFQMLVVFDDMLDDHKLMRFSKQLEILFVRARHLAISTVVSVQKYRSVMTSARVNTTDEFVFANIRNQHDLKAWLEESFALIPEDQLLEIYRRAKQIPYAFLWLKKQAMEDDLIHIGFNPAEKLT